MSIPAILRVSHHRTQVAGERALSEGVPEDSSSRLGLQPACRSVTRTLVMDFASIESILSLLQALRERRRLCNIPSPPLSVIKGSAPAFKSISTTVARALRRTFSRQE